MTAFRYLDDLRRASGMTHQQIAEHSGVPVGTVSRIFSGQTKDPGFATVASIVKAMGGSLDELTGTANPKRSEVKTPNPKYAEAVFEQSLRSSREAYQNAYDSIQAQHEVELKRVKAYLEIKDKWLRWMFAYCVVFTVILAAVCVFKL